MKVALVHELLTMRGGAERVLRIFSQMFPDAPIYTLLYDEKKLGDWFPRERVRVSNLQARADFLNHFSLFTFHSAFNHHLYLKKFPAAVESWDFSGYDLVLSSSSAFAHGIITNGAPKHLCYVNSPARYLWDRTHDVLERAGRGPLGALRRWYLSRLFHRLRIWDSEAADRPDTLIAASREVQRRIELYWRRDSQVIHPPIDDFWIEENREQAFLPALSADRMPAPKINEAPYYLIVSQLVPYKKIDLAIHACNERKTTLIIAGEGPARRSLEAMAGPTVSFAGYRSDAELRTLYTGARATIFPGEEDFGLVPLESLACGTPVIALRAGGARETLTQDTAEFFEESTTQALSAAIGRSEKRSWDRDHCRMHAQTFGRARFERQIHDAISALSRL